jgi:hypothetical protein
MGAWVGTLACSGTPSPDPVERDADAPVVEPELALPSTRADDPLLARGRGQMRDGRVPDAVREQLLVSRDPDHRHAARLLQAVAGETPAAVLSRAGGGEQEVETPQPEAPRPEALRPEPPQPEPPQPEAPQPEAPQVDDDARLDPLPKLDDIPLQSPLRGWLAGAAEVEPEPPPPPIDLPLERLLGPELLLLRERPPRIPTDDGLVILTSMNLWPGRTAGEAWLELSGSGPANVSVQPLDPSHVRLTIADAGAVPSFLAARPEGLGLTILDVVRRERDVEIELVLASGWRLVALEQLGNGATVGFSRSDTLPPS